MSQGKYLSLEEARKSGKLDRFAQEHPSQTDRDRFARLCDDGTMWVVSSKKNNQWQSIHNVPQEDENGARD
jgi:hypothetical protein